MLIRRFKMVLLLAFALIMVYRGTTYSDPVGSGVIPVVMCALMALVLSMLSLGLATKASDPLFF